MSSTQPCVAMERKDLAELIDEALRKHSQEVMAQLDAWMLRLDAVVQAQISSPAFSPGHGVTNIPREEEETETDADESQEGKNVPDPIGSGKDTAARATRSTTRSRRASRMSYDEALEQAARVDFQRTQSQIIQQSTETGVLERIQRMARFITSLWIFDFFFLLLILSNSVLLGVQLQMSATGAADSTTETFFTGINVVYAVLFTFEVGMRIVAHGWKSYLCGPGWAWGWLDTTVVIAAWVELVAGLVTQSEDGESSSNLRIIRLFRITRLLQTVRSLRLIRFLSALRTLVYSMVGATKSLFWTLLLLGLVLYVFGILFTDACLDHSNNNGSDANLSHFFGSLTISMTTLYRSVLAGVDWHEPADSLRVIGEGWVQLFNFYMALSMLALLNVMTGVFCNSAIRAAEKNHDVMMQHRSALRAAASQIFQKMDMSGFGTITITEFERVYNDEDMKTFLESLEISATDAWTLFNSLNLDGDHVLTLEEFTEGCLLLRGSARSVDVFALKQQNKKMRDTMLELAKSQEEMHELMLKAKGLNWITPLHGAMEIQQH
mmetsp:Transcript_7656/g.17608  ORF Transcript_7656/g.17608 Transcript_7656/m.17608 type:complete len:551 (-) Transcript_7656:133-1785(-)